MPAAYAIRAEPVLAGTTLEWQFINSGQQTPSHRCYRRHDRILSVSLRHPLHPDWRDLLFGRKQLEETEIGVFLLLLPEVFALTAPYLGTAWHARRPDGRPAREGT